MRIAARPGEHHPRPAHRLRRSLGGRPLRPVGRRDRAAVGGVRRGPSPHPPHRGRCRRPRDPHLATASSTTASTRTPHMFFYHVNLGYPLLDEGSRYLAPIRDVVWAAHAGARYARRMSATGPCPRRGSASASRSGSTRSPPTTAARSPVALVNDRLALGFEVGHPQGPAALLLRVAEFSGRALRAGNRAVDAPCPG